MSKWSPEALKNHKGMSGKSHSDSTKTKIGRANSVALKGRRLTVDHKQNIRVAIIRAGNIPPVLKGTDSPFWKGDLVGYHALHDWVERELRKPTQCEHCPQNDPKRVYHWANKSHQYKRDKADWIRLCVPCHRKYDYSYTGVVKKVKR